MGWLLAASRTSTLVHFCRTPARHITSLGDKSHNSCVFGAAYVCGGQFLNVSYQATLPEQPRRGVQFNRNVEVCMCVCRYYVVSRKFLYSCHNREKNPTLLAKLARIPDSRAPEPSCLRINHFLLICVTCAV